MTFSNATVDMNIDDAEIARLLGPPLVFTLLNWGLFGVLSVQVYLYSQAFPKDRPTLKAMVYGVYLIETTQTALLTGTAWNLLVKGFGHVAALNEVGTIWMSVCFIGGATGMVAQTFYAYRIWIISENNIIPISILLMALVSFIAAVVLSAITGRNELFSSVQLHSLTTTTFVGIWTGTSAAGDIVIAACMCFFLSKRIRDGCFPKTRALVSKVKLMTIETGALTASISTITLAMYYAPGFSHFLNYGVPISALAKLYSNTMLAVLNSRMKISTIAESTTWQHNELPLIPLTAPAPPPEDIMVIDFASVNTQDSDNKRLNGEKQEAGAVIGSEAEMGRR